MTFNIAINTRFSTRPMTGVDRVAHELTQAMTSVGENFSIQGLAPRNTVISPLSIPVIHGFLSGHLWEQLELPTKIRDAFLLSPCNTGPIMVRNQILIIHDAQTWIHPEAYSPQFRYWYQFLLPRLARKSRLVITISEYSRSQLEKFGVVPPGKARIMQNGADHILRISPDVDTLARHGLTDNGYFLALGSLSPHKNLSLLMRAAAARPEGQPPLVIAGGGNSRVFAAAGLAPPPGVRLLGRVTDNELRALYEHATALVFPSLTEGFGLPPLEAMLCGCPTLVATAGAIPEVCGNASIYIDPRDEAGWTRAMLEIANNSAQRNTARIAGSIQAAPFTWERAARQVIEHLSHELAGEETCS